MKTPLILLCLLVAMCGVVVASFVTEEAPTGRGVTHSTFETMDEGGPASRHTHSVLTLGWIFGMLQVALFVGFLTLAARRDARGLIRALILSGVAYAEVFTITVFVYQQNVATAEAEFIGSFPAATTWMLFGLWPVPFLFVVVYVVGFRRWVWSPDDRERFEQILAARKAQPEAPQ